MLNHILIIDDEENLTFFVKKNLELEGYAVSVAHSVSAGRAAIETQFPDLLLLDLNLPDGNGLDLYGELREKHFEMPCIIITAYGTIQSAIEAMKKGVDDYIVKPFDMKELLILVKYLLERCQLKNQLRYYRQKAQCENTSDFFVSRLPAIQEIQELALKIAEIHLTTVLIEGPTGSGKEMLARFIHNNSAQAHAPFIEINCASLPETLLESELFGHEPGAFTDAKKRKIGLIELAEGGTLFLDEIAEMPFSLQAKLLRFLENLSFKRLGGVTDIKVEVRIIAAANKNIEQLVREQKFRDDLFYRLNLFRLILPALAERKDEILLLSQFFLEKIARRLNKKVRHLSKECYEIIYTYDWPGNMRELHNVIERAVILTNSDTIFPALFPKEILELRNREAVYQPNLSHLQNQSLKGYLNSIEKTLVKQAFAVSEGNQLTAAKLLKEPRHIIRYLLKKHQLSGE